MTDLVVAKNKNKVIEATKERTVEYDGREAKLVDITVYREKILEIIFFNGEKNETIKVENLAEKIGNQTREQRLLQRIMEGDGHIMLAKDGRIIRVKNIISVTPKWEKLHLDN